MFIWISKVREDKLNIEILNYMCMVYLFFLVSSYKISGTILYCIVLLFFLNKKFKEHLFYAFKNKFVQACLAYFLVFVIWVIASDNYSYALIQIKINKFLLYSVLFVAVIRKEFFKKYLYVFLFGIFINIIWLYLTFFGFISSDNYLLMPLDQAFLIFLGISYCLYRLLKYDDKILDKILFFIFICLGSINIFMLKKTEMVLYLFVIFVTLIYIYKKNILKILGIFLIFLSFFLLIINFLLPNIKNQLIYEAKGIYNSIKSDNYMTSMGIRIGIAKYSFEVISDNLFFGIGTGDHSFAVKERIEQSNLKENSKESYSYLLDTLVTGKDATLHNAFLQVLVQFGVIGFLVFLNIFYQISKYIKNSTDINSCLLLSILVIVLLRFNTGWDFQFGNLGQLFIISVVILSINVKKRIIN